MVSAACLAIAVVSGLVARRDATRPPTAAERAAAEATAVAQRWRVWTAGRIFPASLSYSTSLLTTETAARVAIANRTSCAAALDPSLAALTVTDRCQAGLRAAYLDQLQGIVYTVGVLAFPSARLAAAFARRVPTSGPSALVLRAVELPGTATALASDQSRQAATSRTAGPFVVLTVAGYADGEPAGPGQEPRVGIFAPASQLAADVAGPLSAPAQVNCASPQWAC
ncbi:MAG TPA: hypothetical protein VEV45_00805 [Streptosporangiaceae bacterium]|nr:hypothetical protein [Streptosporangiaceae bacterium]